MKRLRCFCGAALVALSLSAAARADSLWNEQGESLFTDNKAYRVGDIITIIVIEEAKVSSSAAKALSKKDATDAAIETLEIPGTQIFPANERPRVKENSSRTFDGSGSYQLQGSMQTNLTAVVLEVLPNGNLVVEGSRLRQSVEEKVTVRVSGIVRPADIRSDNTVLSTSMAEGKIVFDTTGPIAQNSRRGLPGKIIDILWPF